MKEKKNNYRELTPAQFKKRINKIKSNYEEALKNVDNLRVIFSEGNTKMGAIPSVSLIPVLDCVNCGICSKSCYDLRNDMIYKQCINSRCVNSAIFHVKPEEYFMQIDTYLTYKYPRAFRWHVGGDIQNDYYFQKMVEIAVKHSKVKFLCFTKNFPVVNRFLNNGGVIPENLYVLFSGWRGLKMDNPHHLPEAHPIFQDGTSAPQGTKLCTGNCTECLFQNKLCFNIKRGGAVGFLAH